jgi:malonyl-CoA O-methyltransferase
MLPTMNAKIRRGFSGSARSYDLYSSMHRQIADKLLAQVIKGAQPATVLDVGCGTGYMTGKLRDHFPYARIIGLDFAQGMLDVACDKHEGIEWVLADGHQLPFADGSSDMLVSNLAYQWAGDLSRVFAEARRMLSSNGIFACTLFGHNTCQELFQCLQEARPGALQFDRLPDEAQVRRALASSGFEGPVVDCGQVKLEFKDMQALMTWLKRIGANHLSREGFLGPAALSRAAEIYRERFSSPKGITATFEVIQIYVKN